MTSNNSSSAAVVDCMFEWTNPGIDQRTTMVYDAILWTFSILNWTFGLAMILGILHYERFGGDPQKRSLGNRLISSGILSLLGQCVCAQLNLVLIRLDIGTYNIYMTLLRGYVGLGFSTMGFVEANFVLRYLQIFVWGRVKEINEELAMRCIGRSMILVAIAIGYCINFNIPMITFFMTFSTLHKKTIAVETKLCQQKAYPHFDFWNLR